jgi:hypothetical protein
VVQASLKTTSKTLPKTNQTSTKKPHQKISGASTMKKTTSKTLLKTRKTQTH